MVAEPPQRLFTIDEYECMIQAGILRSGERVELIDGRILTMAAMGGPHVAAISRFTRVFGRVLPPTADVHVQTPIRLPPDWEPEPDISIVRHRDDDYVGGPPGVEDVLLVVEIGDSTVAWDRDHKLPRYAAAGLPESWLVDLPDDRIRRYRLPREDRYTEVVTFGRGETIAPLAFPDLVLAVDDLLPPLAH